ncbi:hypothetical protein CEUSTIGMA_g12624.t1 [Chlamydomonas eustigma]|uniref:Uncharacterized protein n=1 Tax=Chlamydomonas eustigma TaxID=1157962 RepID=A0A250XQ47_9CHLO|nr:hypothetical protein CEUSTIGMA_g12624.t1 [Chlamydomonas eustigma]|eukprot:GAX85204.1 hypothetical protein CEUSTIGMA_g12624.t1 [Chlamydomonas eustigma]
MKDKLGLRAESKIEDKTGRANKVRRVTFSKGPILNNSADGHPCHEGETAYRVRSIGTTWGGKLTKRSMEELEELFQGPEYQPSICRLKRRLGLLPTPQLPPSSPPTNSPGAVQTNLRLRSVWMTYKRLIVTPKKPFSSSASHCTAGAENALRNRCMTGLASNINVPDQRQVPSLNAKGHQDRAVPAAVKCSATGKCDAAVNCDEAGKVANQRHLKTRGSSGNCPACSNNLKAQQGAVASSETTACARRTSRHMQPIIRARRQAVLGSPITATSSATRRKAQVRRQQAAVAEAAVSISGGIDVRLRRCALPAGRLLLDCIDQCTTADLDSEVIKSLAIQKRRSLPEALDTQQVQRNKSSRSVVRNGGRCQSSAASLQSKRRRASSPIDYLTCDDSPTPPLSLS